MAHRAFIQVIITGTQVFGKAFAEAYRQAASQSVKQGATNATRRGTGKGEYGGITLDESCKILNVEEGKGDLNMDKVNDRFKYLFEVNDKEKGGSFYLQSKVYRAAERLKWELAQRDKQAGAKAGGDTSTAKPSSNSTSSPGGHKDASPNE
ncbi:hypothetical protein SKDZ_10G1100 [Saccharomyces kudriavzevii ZP591]|uniref:Uncharacterized protein n=3 Tax=Saccharomyces TaxID=4930 RepID=A0AA35IZP6_SACK1|nr:uncharacterized protein SKDI_10G1120 [Saccharomyces kudriavzevii IFO 1802]EHN01750.1 Pam16p [Saccharomyces cerevisiae x Saccharomyces kudriavzevii VIN7]EJT41248.1 PAM16-like protein [Saccharomyces kudriavzevii IFO 1802]CAI4043617.1 hypothetical protein SKDZ_10G1100 [Saccharomyces kudriavzevii ZP591]CAI4043620.1 hypothetical protein SKDI_10G1120 [Saccharomyces kudriavzevii IFO 1802]